MGGSTVSLGAKGVTVVIASDLTLRERGDPSKTRPLQSLCSMRLLRPVGSRNDCALFWILSLDQARDPEPVEGGFGLNLK